MNPKRILLVAYQCGPGMGSVSQIGWEWFNRLRAGNRVTLVTHVRNRPALETALAGDSADILYIDTEWFAGPLYRLAKRVFPRSEHSVFLVSSLDYFVFDIAAYRALKKKQSSGSEWNILHRVTPVTLAAPTLLGRLGLPTVIGPLNSGLQDPRGFGNILKQESTWLIKVRKITAWLDALIGSSRRAACILVANRTTLNALPVRHHDRCLLLSENAVELVRFPMADWPPPPGPDTPLNVLFTGRLIPIKGLDMLLHAMSRLHRSGVNLRLEVIGDGPLRKDWEDLTETLGLSGIVNFRGAQPLDRVAESMRACHVFCLPSVRESGGAVLLEAMASGRPVIALDFGGPADIVDDRVGALLPMRNPEQVIAALAETLGRIEEQPGHWSECGLAGRARVETNFSWPAKIVRAETIYQALIRQEKPA